MGAVAGLLGLPALAHGRDYGFRRSHNCPRCGTLRLNVDRMNYPGPGYHQHRCGSTTWHH